MAHTHENLAAIRRAGSDDYEGIVDVWTQAGLSYRPQGRDSRQSVDRELQRGTGAFFLAEAEGHPVGVVLGTHDGRKGWINRLAVIPEFRRRGLARLLVREVEVWLEAEGIKVWAALIDSPNQESIAFFTKSGYLHDPGVEYFSKRRGSGA